MADPIDAGGRPVDPLSEPGGAAPVPPVSPVSRLPLIIMGAVVVLAVLVTIALLAVRDPTEYEPGTPEAALQEFLQAGFDGRDASELIDLLTPEARAGCEAELRRRPIGVDWDREGLRADLDSMRVDGDRAAATVTLRHDDSANPFGNNSYDFSVRYDLVDVDGTWLVDRAGWPYPFDMCTSGVR